MRTKGDRVFLLPAGVPDTIECADEFGARRPCGRCGSVVFACEPGKGPHALGLRCHCCGKDYRWLGTEQVEQIKTKEAAFEHAEDLQHIVKQEAPPWG